MKNKKMIVNVVMILITILAIIALLIYDNIQQKEGLESGNSDIPLVEEITPPDTVSQTESKVPPISSEDSSEQEEVNEKAEVEFDIGDYKPIPKDPTVEDITIEYETKEAEINE
ncbi:MAG: hypothetical protein J6S14_18930 [Clostridia bacterium]|nr:hypothetical protein [Clostridia bacterium]